MLTLLDRDEVMTHPLFRRKLEAIGFGVFIPVFFVTSGLRLGSPAVTTRGMGAAEMKEIVRLIDQTILKRADAVALKNIRGEVAALCDKFPIYKGGLS